MSWGGVLRHRRVRKRWPTPVAAAVFAVIGWCRLSRRTGCHRRLRARQTPMVAPMPPPPPAAVAQTAHAAAHASRTRPPPGPAAASPRRDGTISISASKVLQRIEPETVRSYLLLQTGDPWDAERVERSLKALFATGLFADVKLDCARQYAGRQGRREPDHQPHRLRGKFEALRQGPQRRNPAAAAHRLHADPGAERRRSASSISIAGAARFAATVEPKVIQLSENRVDLVFEINEGPLDRRAQHQFRRQQGSSATARCAASSKPRKADGTASSPYGM